MVYSKVVQSQYSYNLILSCTYCGHPCGSGVQWLPPPHLLHLPSNLYQWWTVHGVCPTEGLEQCLPCHQRHFHHLPCWQCLCSEGKYIMCTDHYTILLLQLLSWALVEVWHRLVVAGCLAVAGILTVCTATGLGRGLVGSWRCWLMISGLAVWVVYCFSSIS